MIQTHAEQNDSVPNNSSLKQNFKQLTGISVNREVLHLIEQDVSIGLLRGREADGQLSHGDVGEHQAARGTGN